MGKVTRKTAKPKKSRTVSGAEISLRLALAQVNSLVGGFKANAESVKSLCTQARKMGADIVLFPELMLTGYPPEDLLLRPSLNGRVDDALALIGERIEVPVVLGYPAVRNGVRRNAAGVLFPGDSRPRHEYFKQCLPNYRVFDEKRSFPPGDQRCVFELGRERLAITICEDIWFEGPAAQAARASWPSTKTAYCTSPTSIA